MMNRRFFLQLVVVSSAVAALPLGLIGCGTNQSNLAALAQTLGTSAANLATLIGQSALATKITQLTTQVVGDIQMWKTGSPTADIIQVLGDLELAINLIPIDPMTQMLVELALGTIQAIVALFPAPAAAAVQARAQGVRTVTLPKPPKKASDYKVQWNAIVDGNPKLAPARI